MPKTAPKTTVVNLRNRPYQVYIGRSRRGQPPSKWGNPFPVGKPLTPHLAKLITGHPVLHQHQVGATVDRAAAIALYRALLETRLQSGQLKPADFLAIHGSSLGCFCKPQACHGDVIAEFCERFYQQSQMPQAARAA